MKKESIKKSIFRAWGRLVGPLFSLFQNEGGVWSRKDIGAAHPTSGTVNNNMATHRFSIPANTSKTIYIRMQSADALMFPFFLRTETEFAVICDGKRWPMESLLACSFWASSMALCFIFLPTFGPF